MTPLDALAVGLPYVSARQIAGIKEHPDSKLDVIHEVMVSC